MLLLVGVEDGGRSVAFVVTLVAGAVVSPSGMWRRWG